jgi:hypothetical protein
MKMEIKDKIESILDNCNVNSFQYKDDGYAHEVTISDLASKIMELLPRKRYPEKDGWPEASALIDYCFCCSLGDDSIELFTCSMLSFNIRGYSRKNILWYIPVSEILEMLGDKNGN